MRTLRVWVAMAVVVCLWLAMVAESAPREVAGEVEEVILYRGQAMVSRKVPVDLPRGTSELIVPDLPQHIVQDSVFATAGDAVDVRAVRYRTRAVSEAPREEIRQVEKEMEDLQDELNAVSSQKQVATHGNSFLDKLENFVAPTAQTELTKGVLDAETLQTLTNFIMQSRSENADIVLKLKQKEDELKKKLELSQRKHRQLTAGSTRTVREAVLFLESPREQSAQIKLSYLVQQAGWDPIYNVRASNSSENVEIEYNAAIHQMSGESWKDVELTLSTASPVLTAEAPSLAPFWVSLTRQQAQQAQVSGGRRLGEQYARYRGQVMEQARQRQATSKGEVGQKAAWSMNMMASNAQAMELMAGKEVTKTGEAVERRAEGMSVTYHLPGRISLESRSDTQMVRIADLELKGHFYQVATPVLTGFVYRQGTITNDSDKALLEGPASMYLDGDFVGKSTVPMVARSQQFDMGFGLDPALRASRELVDRKEQTLGANREITFTYRLRLKNFREKPVEVRLYDRLPRAHGRQDMRVTMVETSDELSEDSLYQEIERPKGILRWEIKVSGNVSGADARKVEYTYTLEFDRSLAITTPEQAGQPGASQQFQEEFQQMEKMRRKAH